MRHTETGSDDSLLLRINEVARLLSCSRATVYRRLIDTGAIKVVRVGSAPRIRRSDLDDFIGRAS